MILSDFRRFLSAALVLCALALAPIRAGAEGVLVFAAASLKTALDEIAPEYEQQAGQDVTISYAASSVLARQIQLGAPADLFISANSDWMDVLQADGLIDVSSRVDLLGNGLVLIGAADRVAVGQIGPDYDLTSELNGGYLAMALVDAVPAGIYGKVALQGLGLWDTVDGQVAQSDNVRAALALVAVGAAPLGIVYRSDAQAETRVSVVGTFPADLHPPIIYPAAVTVSAKPGAQAFLSYLQTDAAEAIFLEQGFALPGGGS
ncbi:molybdate ABC transporter substrate-binding protein [Rhodobacteraceae bacterium B1Z28]|uniref:Molybdate ABC transporter substrate-binding protein n=1 Tax=Ruegeria haliotis TaxID=2747601 RepID=A0ABX2PQJ3_9RHOB|nr:molybdate ABC transporter substrate-binding protein [Ruegeria haliotis]NVO56428.1 molybdate ABC transporter substrate-binding protein [Ruegeria haliotis]